MQLKEEILNTLKNNTDNDTSGQELAQKLGVSRSAVWKAINALKSDGYLISSVTNKGYRILPQSDVVSKADIEAMLNKDIPVYCFESIKSTNLTAKKMIIDGDKTGNFLIVANEQTDGRGRSGKSFYSPKNHGVYFSVVFSPESTIENSLKITSYSAFCVAKAIQKLTGKNAEIKWVNDIYIDGKKVCGILTEAVTNFESGSVGNIITGIGINLSPCEMPEEIKDTAGFINFEKPIKNRLIAEIVNGILSFNANDNSFMNDYKKMSFTIGKKIKFHLNSVEHTGTVIDIDDNSGLVIKYDNKEITLRSGEITLI